MYLVSSSTFTLDDGQSLAGTGAVTGDITFASTNSTGANFQDGSKINPVTLPVITELEKLQ